MVVYHGYYTAPNPLGEHPLLCVDMWRIEDGKIQEHWDALHPMPKAQVDLATAGGGDGEGAVTKPTVMQNKQTVHRFLDYVLNRGRLDLLPSLVHPNYVYHHESEGPLTGLAVLQDHIAQKNGGRMLHDTKQVIGSGDLILAHTHQFGTPERVAFDWFRMDEGKIAEHWRVEQPITPLDQVANAHPHF